MLLVGRLDFMILLSDMHIILKFWFKFKFQFINVGTEGRDANM